jgi:hypothetical protein
MLEAVTKTIVVLGHPRQKKVHEILSQRAWWHAYHPSDVRKLKIGELQNRLA